MVIQRWQSLLLLFAGVMAIVFSFCCIGNIEGASQSVDIFSYGVYNTPQGTPLIGSVYVTIVALLAAVLSVVNIFMFRNTRLQKQVCLLVLVLIIAAGCTEYFVIQGLDIAGAKSIAFESAAFSPVLAVLAVIIAHRRIRSDERKLAAADRLR